MSGVGAAGVAPARGDPARRVQRWVRIHVQGTQRCDVFWPIAVGGEAAPLSWPPRRARLGLLDAHACPDRVACNGLQVELRDPVREGGWTWLDVHEPGALLPGENIVALDTRVDPHAVRLRLEGVAAGSRPAGWGAHAQGLPAADGSGDPHLDAAVGFLRASLSRHPHWDDALISLTAYDPGAQAPRLWSWLWTTALTYEALDTARARWGFDVDLSGLERTLLARQVRSPSPDVHGSYMVRFDLDTALPTGVIPWHAPNDGAFIGMHGLLPAWRRTGDARFLDAARALCGWILDRGLRDDRLLVGWDAARQRWDDRWLYVDAAWTCAFLREVGEATGDARAQGAAEVVARDTIGRFALPDSPFYLKIWRANGHHTRTLFARGMAWVLEGWLPLLRAGSAWLQPRVESLCDGLLAAQRSDGSWSYLLDRPATGPCNKGTPALAYQLLRASELLPNRRDALRGAAQAALRWCERQQPLTSQLAWRGGIVARNAEGAIVTQRGIATAFNYGAAYYLMARALERP